MTERKNQLTAQFEVRVQGILDERWSAWFGGLEVRSEGEDVTLITGRVADQAALHGLLTRINDLGLTLVSVRRTDGREGMRGG
jgi:hypothetical protein